MGRAHRIITSSSGGCYVAIEASPGASKTEIVGIDEWRGSLKVSLAAQPLEGEANKELMRFLSGVFPEAKNRMVIASGGKSRAKKVFVPLDEATISKRLGLDKW